MRKLEEIIKQYAFEVRHRKECAKYQHASRQVLVDFEDLDRLLKAAQASLVPVPMLVTHHFRRKPMPLVSVLRALAGQEGNDGDEGNAMQAAADYIEATGKKK